MLERFLDPFKEFPFTSDCAGVYARIRAQLEGKGEIIGQNDLLIAATAIAYSATLVTNNQRAFKRVVGLATESWAGIEL